MSTKKEGESPVKSIEKLPEAELDVMLCLWRYDEPVRTARILQDVQKEHAWTLSTLKALLSRLDEKGFVEVTREGRFTLYRALVPETEYRRRETGGLLRRYFENSPKNMIAALVRESELTGEDMEELEELIRKVREGHADQEL